MLTEKVQGLIHALATLRGESSVPENVLEDAMVNGLLELIRQRALEGPVNNDLVARLSELISSLSNGGMK